MKKMIRLSVVMAVILFGLISGKTTLAATTEIITEETEWSGTVEGSKVLAFTPQETGFYNVKSTDSADTYTEVTFLTDNDEPVMDKISEYGTGIFAKNAVYLTKNKEYRVMIECVDGEDDVDMPQQMEGNVSLLITKSSDTALPLSEIKKATDAIWNGNCICTYTPEESGTYSFAFESKSDEESYYVDIYSIKEETFSKINTTTRFLNNKCSSTLFQLEAGVEYYFIIHHTSYEDDSSKDGSTISSYTYIKKSNTVTSIELNESPLLSSADFMVYLFNGSIKVHYENGESEILDFYDISANEISAEYLGERDSEDFFIAGKQKVKFIYLDNFEVTTEVDILTRVQYAEKVFGSLSPDKKITVEPDFWYTAEYKFTPSENGYYLLWSNSSLNDMYGNWGMTMYDSSDIKVEFVPGKGYKLKANEDYCFNIYLGNNLTENNFIYWLGIDTEHIHTYGPWVTTSPATATQPGTEERTCTDCGATETRTIDKLPTSSGGGNGSQQTNPTTSGDSNSTGSINTPGSTNISGVINNSDSSVSGNHNSETNSSGSAKTTLAKTTITSVKAKKKGTMVVKWKKTANSKGYQVQYSTNKKFKSKKTKTTAKTSLTIKKLKKKKTYYIRVRAYKTVNGNKIYGKWSSVKSIKIKK